MPTSRDPSSPSKSSENPKRYAMFENVFKKIQLEKKLTISWNKWQNSFKKLKNKIFWWNVYLFYLLAGLDAAVYSLHHEVQAFPVAGGVLLEGDRALGGPVLGEDKDRMFIENDTSTENNLIKNCLLMEEFFLNLKKIGSNVDNLKNDAMSKEKKTISSHPQVCQPPHARAPPAGSRCTP